MTSSVSHIGQSTIYSVLGLHSSALQIAFSPFLARVGVTNGLGAGRQADVPVPRARGSDPCYAGLPPRAISPSRLPTPTRLQLCSVAVLL